MTEFWCSGANVGVIGQQPSPRKVLAKEGLSSQVPPFPLPGASLSKSLPALFPLGT
jgi:hypothetical protein